jgi:hypothetical protein
MNKTTLQAIKKTRRTLLEMGDTSVLLDEVDRLESKVDELESKIPSLGEVETRLQSLESVDNNSLLKHITLLKGEKGDDAPPVDEEKLAETVFAKVRIPNDGQPGAPGKNADEEKIFKALVRRLPGPEKIDEESIIAKILPRIPKIKEVKQKN